MEPPTFISVTSNSARPRLQKPMKLGVQWRMSQNTEDMLRFQLSPVLLTLSHFSFKCFLTFRLVIIVITRQFPFYSYHSLISVLHLLHLSHIWPLLPEDMDMGFRCATQRASFYVIVSLLYRTLPRQPVASAISQKHRDAHFLLLPTNNLT